MLHAVAKAVFVSSEVLPIELLCADANGIKQSKLVTRIVGLRSGQFR